MRTVIWRKITHEATRSDAVPINEYILVARPSGVSSIAWELLTARYDPDWRGWTNVHGDRLTDSGVEPKYWAYLPLAKYMRYDV